MKKLKKRLKRYKTQLKVIQRLYNKAEGSKLSPRRTRRLRVLKGYLKGSKKGIRTTKRLIRKANGPDKAVAWAKKQVGTTESPPSSNRGPKIDTWQRLANGTVGYPWCGAFVYAALHHAGVQGLSSRMVYTPYILFDAKDGKNGLAKLVPFEQCQKGDLVLMDFAPGGDPVMHVGIATGPASAGYVPTIEGNTSAGASGSQDNGGGVFARQRPKSVVVGCARPRWP